MFKFYGFSTIIQYMYSVSEKRISEGGFREPNYPRMVPC